MVAFFQYIFYSLFHGVCIYVLQVRVQGLEHIDRNKRQGFILAANHSCRIDMCLLAALPFSKQRILIPYSFMTADYYYKKWWFRSFISLFGAYPIKNTASSYEALFNTSIDQLKKGNTLVMFPEGRILKRNESVSAKPGIAFLAAKTHVPIIPLYIDGFNKISLKKIFLRKSRITLIFGAPIHLNLTEFRAESYRQASQEILKAIYSLRGF